MSVAVANTTGKLLVYYMLYVLKVGLRGRVALRMAGWLALWLNGCFALVT